MDLSDILLSLFNTLKGRRNLLPCHHSVLREQCRHWPAVVLITSFSLTLDAVEIGRTVGIFKFELPCRLPDDDCSGQALPCHHLNYVLFILFVFVFFCFFLLALFLWGRFLSKGSRASGLLVAA